ncbi:MAG TPA: Ig-like domain-containing protein [Nitrospirota bacterium]|nr:Ig-like domain-containing protein [Nitrospirota bacterium]
MRTLRYLLYLLLLASCMLNACGGSGGGGGSTTSSSGAPYISGELDSLSRSNDSAATVYVLDNSTGNPIKNATVIINNVSLGYNGSTGAYEGSLLVAPGAIVILTVSANGNTYTVTGNQFSSYPIITTPASGSTWPICCTNTVNWSSPGQTSHAFYGIAVEDAATGNVVWPLSGYLWELSGNTFSYNIPNNTLAAGNDVVLVDMAQSLSISNAAYGSQFIISGYSYIPINVADISATLVSISIGPSPNGQFSAGNPVITKGASQQFAATGIYCDGSTKDLTTSVTWNSSDTSVATISNTTGSNGMATSIAGGTITISAALNNIVGSMTLTVSSWSQQTSGTSQDLLSVAWSGTQFVAVGYQTILTSSDGIIWTQPVQTQISFDRVCWLDNQFFAVGPGNILASSDGVQWTLRMTGNNSNGYYPYDVAWSGSNFVAAGLEGYTFTSPDGITWTPQLFNIYSPNMYSVAWSGTKFVMVGSGGIVGSVGIETSIFTSPDGFTWTLQDSNTNFWITGYRVIWTGSQFIAVGADFQYDKGIFLMSPDGVAWTVNRVGNTGTILYDIALSGTNYVAVGGPGVIYSSTDGVTWTLMPTGISKYLNGVAVSPTRSVAVGQGGIILTNP